MFQKASFYFSSLLRSCLHHFSISHTKQCHAQILLQALLPNNITLQTDLLLAYSKCRLLPHARQVFNQMPHKNMHSWNIIIASYVESSLFSDAIAVFHEFQHLGLRPDHYTLPPLFKACIGLGDSDGSLGRTCHGFVMKLGYEGYVVVGNCVLEYYAECGAMSEARCVFFDMVFRDSAVWNLMISRFARAGLYVDALECFRGMVLSKVKIDCMTFPSVLNACGREGDLMKGKEVHGQIIKGFVFSVDVAIGNALIDMYGKCGCLNYADKVFKNMDGVNLVTWTTMISCYGMHGKGEESLNLFKKMIDIGFTPNPVTLTAILASCSHSGLVDQGMQIFNSVYSEYGFEPSVEHYACIVDLLGRCGYLMEALEILESMKSSATASIWGALLAGCLMHKNVKIGEIAAYHLFQLEPNNASNYVALCSIYEAHGMLEGVSSVRAKLRKLDLVKAPGYSGINIGGRFHKFYQGDLSLPLAQIIHEISLQISRPEMADDCEWLMLSSVHSQIFFM